jgi:hypothetical protein
MRPIHISGMEEPGEPVIGTIDRTADKSSNARRSQEAVSCKMPHDDDVIVGDAAGRRLRCAAESRPASRSHSRLAPMRPL